MRFLLRADKVVLDDVTDALDAVRQAGQQVVDAGLDFLGGGQVAAVLHRLCRTGL